MGAVVCLIYMDTRSRLQPRLAFTDELSVNDNPHSLRKRTSINDHLWFVDDDQSRVVFFRHEAIYQSALDDKEHLRFIAVSLRLNGHATQSEIVQAFGHSVRTQRDWETQYQKEGLRGLQRKTGSGRRPHMQSSQDALLRKWFQQGVTQKVMAERLGVSINVVKRAWARLGLRRGKTTGPSSGSENGATQAVASGQNRTSQVLDGRSGPAADRRG